MNGMFQQLQQYIAQRYAGQAGKSLWQIYQLEPDVLSVSPEFVEFAYAERHAIAKMLQTASAGNALIRDCCEHTKAFTQQKNQFISFSMIDDLLLVQVYRRLMDGIAFIVGSAQSVNQLDELFQKNLRQHFLSLRAFTHRFLANDTSLAPVEQFIFKEPVCREYSSSLQLEMLAVDETQLKEPILDIGCGQNGHLVNYLRKKGHAAFGVDRACPSSRNFENADWLNLDLQENHWGSILSHMAFSNHFLFHHVYKHGQPGQYAKQFMKILSALKAGGSFYYTPGLPFIESLLPNSQYTCQRRPINISRVKSLDDAPYQHRSDQDVLYSAKISRIH